MALYLASPLPWKHTALLHHMLLCRLYGLFLLRFDFCFRPWPWRNIFKRSSGGEFIKSTRAGVNLILPALCCRVIVVEFREVGFIPLAFEDIDIEGLNLRRERSSS